MHIHIQRLCGGQCPHPARVAGPMCGHDGLALVCPNPCALLPLPAQYRKEIHGRLTVLRFGPICGRPENVPESVNMLDYMAKGIKIADGRKVANQLALK